MTTTDNDRILEKIRKCLALSQSDNPHEAAQALKCAQALMKQHNLDTGDLALHEIGHDDVRSMATATKVKPYELQLLSCVASAFGCDLLWVAGWSDARRAEEVYGRYRFVGPKTQVAVAVHTGVVLVRRLAKARAEYIKSQTDFWMDRQQKSALANGFCDGWVDEIFLKVVDFAQPDETKQAIKLYKQKKLNVYGKLKLQNQVTNDLGYHDGRDAAKGESLHRPMDGKTSLKLTHK